MMNDKHYDSLTQATTSEKPFLALYTLAEKLRDEGFTQAELFALYDEYRTLGEEGNETSYNAVLDVMDCIVGWCAPHFKLFDTLLDEFL
jgi:hypothetical protein